MVYKSVEAENYTSTQELEIFSEVLGTEAVVELVSMVEQEIQEKIKSIFKIAKVYTSDIWSHLFKTILG